MLLEINMFSIHLTGTLSIMYLFSFDNVLFKIREKNTTISKIYIIKYFLKGFQFVFFVPLREITFVEEVF